MLELEMRMEDLPAAFQPLDYPPDEKVDWETKVKDSYMHAALEWVNDIRETELGLPRLPKLLSGYRVAPTRCPIAMSLMDGTKDCDFRVTHTYVLMLCPKPRRARSFYRQQEPERKRLTVPHAVGRFVVDFDMGRFPELVISPS